MKSKLADLCYYAEDKVNITSINEDNYISTENMLPNKGGITKATTLPNASQVKAFHEGDILISNIRPYFKKIWRAQYSGGCSNDVLVFRSKAKTSQRFLYYILSDNNFFEYSTKTSKGTKMPRGDKTALMQYEVSFYKFEEQEIIADILEPIDRKIELNTQINKNLDEYLIEIFEHLIVHPMDYPKDWNKGYLTDIAIYLNGLAMQKFRPEDNEVENSLPVLKIKELRQGYCDQSSDICSNKIPKDYVINDGDIIFSWSGSLLVDVWAGGRAGLNQHLFKVSSKNYPKWFYYLWTKHYEQEFIATAAARATTMGHIKRSHLESAEVVIPNSESMNKFNQIFSPLLEMKIQINQEAKKLKELRDSLLPKLLSGEINLSQ